MHKRVALLAVVAAAAGAVAFAAQGGAAAKGSGDLAAGWGEVVWHDFPAHGGGEVVPFH